MAKLRRLAPQNPLGSADPTLTRAADLLERLSPPQPVPVSERLPGPEDCDEEGVCWCWHFIAHTWGMFRLDLSAHSYWLPVDALPDPWRLPAHALPVPGEVEG